MNEGDLLICTYKLCSKHRIVKQPSEHDSHPEQYLVQVRKLSELYKQEQKQIVSKEDLVDKIDSQLRQVQQEIMTELDERRQLFIRQINSIFRPFENLQRVYDAIRSYDKKSLNTLDAHFPLLNQVDEYERVMIEIHKLVEKEEQFIKSTSFLEMQRSAKQQQSVDVLEKIYLEYPDGTYYRGQGTKSHKRQGYGVLIDKDQREIYSGFWHDDRYEGEGLLTNSNPSATTDIDWIDLTRIKDSWITYQGEFKQGAFHGQGFIKFADEQTFKGEFNDGRIDGVGIFTDKLGEPLKGRWKDGLFVQIQI